MPIVFASVINVPMPPKPSVGPTGIVAIAPPVPPLGNGTVQVEPMPSRPGRHARRSGRDDVDDRAARDQW